MALMVLSLRFLRLAPEIPEAVAARIKYFDAFIFSLKTHVGFRRPRFYTQTRKLGALH